MPTQLPILSSWPPAPNKKTQEPAQFDDTADTWAGNMIPATAEWNAFATAGNQLALELESYSDSAYSSAQNASTFADVAMSMANFKGNYPSLTGAIAIPSSVWYSGNVYMLLQNLADVTTVTPGTNPAVWANLTAAMSGYTNPLTTKGDIIVADTGGVQTRFAAPTTASKAFIFRYDVDTQAFSWHDEADYLGGGSGGAAGDVNWYDVGNVAASASESVTVNFNNGLAQRMSMEASNTTGSLTLNLTNLPDTTNKTQTLLLLIRRAGRKPISISASGFTLNYAQGVAPNYNSNSGYFDIVQIVKKFGSTNLDVAVIGTGIF